MNAPDKLAQFITLTREPLESMSEEFKRTGGEIYIPINKA
jgi:hypothetical protein